MNCDCDDGGHLLRTIIIVAASIVAMLCCFLPFPIIGFVFLGLPNTRNINIAQYNTDVANWKILSPKLEPYNLTYVITPSSGFTTSGRLEPSYVNSDIIHNTRPGDNFSTYQQLKWLAELVPLYTGESFSTSKTVQVQINVAGPPIVPMVYTHRIPIFQRESYSCKCGDSYCTCYNYYRLSEIGYTMDLLNFDRPQVLPLGGRIDGAGKWNKVSYRSCSTFGTYSLEAQLVVRDVNDPYYRIQFLNAVGYFPGGTWGVTEVDRQITYGVFFSITGLICFACCFCIVLQLCVGLICSVNARKRLGKAIETIGESFESEPLPLPIVTVQDEPKPIVYHVDPTPKEIPVEDQVQESPTPAPQEEYVAPVHDHYDPTPIPYHVPFEHKMEPMYPKPVPQAVETEMINFDPMNSSGLTTFTPTYVEQPQDPTPFNPFSLQTDITSSGTGVGEVSDTFSTFPTPQYDYGGNGSTH